jgi:hypothetical protein
MSSHISVRAYIQESLRLAVLYKTRLWLRIVQILKSDFEIRLWNQIGKRLLVPHRKAAKKSDPKSGPRFGRFFYPCCESDVVDECKDVRGAKVEEGKECLVDGGVREKNWNRFKTRQIFLVKTPNRKTNTRWVTVQTSRRNLQRPVSLKTAQNLAQNPARNVDDWPKSQNRCNWWGQKCWMTSGKPTTKTPKIGSQIDLY